MARVSIIAVTVSCLTAIVTIIITVLLFHQLYCVRKNYHIPSWFKLPSLFACICYILSSIIFTISLFYIDMDKNLESALICFITLAISIFLSKFFTYLTLLSRLYFTFNRSKYKISPCIMRLMITMLILSIFAVIWLSVIFYMNFVSKHRSYRRMNDIQILTLAIQTWIGMVIIIASDVIISVGLLHLFI